MIIKFDKCAVQAYENETGEVTIQDTDKCLVKREQDTVFGTNEQQVTITPLNEPTWDTNEISMIIESDKTYYDKLAQTVENELYFMVVLWVAIDHWNEKLGDVSRNIDPSLVDGNEVYMSFCQAVGYETGGWK